MVFPAQAVRCILNDVFPNTSRISNRKKWSDGVAKSIRELHGRDGTIEDGTMRNSKTNYRKKLDGTAKLL